MNTNNVIAKWGYSGFICKKKQLFNNKRGPRKICTYNILDSKTVLNTNENRTRCQFSILEKSWDLHLLLDQRHSTQCKHLQFSFILEEIY